MPPLAQLLQGGPGQAWLFIPSAILLGALHGLEPGHSKTMMAAFIIAVRGTVKQAVLLGVAATISHTAVVWLVALAGLRFGRDWSTEATEPYFQIVSATVIVAIALWIFLRTWRDHRTAVMEAVGHDHGHGKRHRVNLGQWTAEVSIFEDNVPQRFRVSLEKGGSPHALPHGVTVTIETERPNGTRQKFAMVERHGLLESVEEVPEPHEFVARLATRLGNLSDTHDLAFTEHDHAHSDYGALEVAGAGYQDAHERAHAQDIQRRFVRRTATTGQIVMFGLTGGLIPCPAAITVLLLCLHLKQFSLGVTLVLCFSIGLAATMVASGVLAALSVHHISKRWSGFGALARRAPYFSSALVMGVGVYLGYQGWVGLMAGPGTAIPATQTSAPAAPR